MQISICGVNFELERGTLIPAQRFCYSHDMSILRQNLVLFGQIGLRTGLFAIIVTLFGKGQSLATRYCSLKSLRVLRLQELKT